MWRIYQLFCGRFESANLRDHQGSVFRRLKLLNFASLREQGFTHVYLLGVFDNRGPLIVGEEEGLDLRDRLDRVPSVFAISDHCQVNPGLGSLADFDELIDSIHQSGLKVLVDFVPNHTGKAHPWLSLHPEYYHLSKQEFSGDVATLDYSNPEVGREMTQVLRTISGWQVDGVRCDMAHLIPSSFWQQATTTIRQDKPDFIFLAEAYSDSVFNWQPLERLLQAGFDGVYHEFAYRNLRDLGKGEVSFVNVVEHFKFTFSRPYAGQLVNYLANHDDSVPEAIRPVFEGWLKFFWTLPQPLLVFNGTLWGHHHRLAHHWLDLLPDEENELVKMPLWFTDWSFQGKPRTGKANLVWHEPIIEVLFEEEAHKQRLIFNPSPHPVDVGEDRLGPGEVKII